MRRCVVGLEVELGPHSEQRHPELEDSSGPGAQLRAKGVLGCLPGPH